MQSIKGFARARSKATYDVKIATAGPSDIRRATQKRSLFADKRQNGTVLVIAGSSEYYGAPSLASTAIQNTLAALRVGSGYAMAYVPSSILKTVRMQSPGVIVKQAGRNSIEFSKDLKKSIDHADAIVIGMGIGRKSRTIKQAAKIMDYAFSRGKKVVVDADAIYALRYTKSKMNSNVVITPQSREFSFLSGREPKARDLLQKARSAVELSKRLKANIVLKGHESVITDGTEVKVSRPRSSALATMGTGDVLAGIIAGYAAGGAKMFDAAVAGTYLHSLIGDRLWRRMGNHIIATDIVGEIPLILKRFDKNSR
jgi:NAD(P)H-hydrate epimerase